MANGNPVTRACKTVKTKTKTKRRNANVAVRCGQTMALQSCHKSRTNETGRAFFCQREKEAAKINSGRILLAFLRIQFLFF